MQDVFAFIQISAPGPWQGLTLPAVIMQDEVRFLLVSIAGPNGQELTPTDHQNARGVLGNFNLRELAAISMFACAHPNMPGMGAAESQGMALWLPPMIPDWTPAEKELGIVITNRARDVFDIAPLAHQLYPIAMSLRGKYGTGGVYDLADCPSLDELFPPVEPINPPQPIVVLVDINNIPEA